MTDAESNYKRAEEGPSDPKDAGQQAFGFVERLQSSLAAGRRPFQDADARFLEDVRAAVDDALRIVSPMAPSS